MDRNEAVVKEIVGSDPTSLGPVQDEFARLSGLFVHWDPIPNCPGRHVLKHKQARSILARHSPHSLVGLPEPDLSKYTLFFKSVTETCPPSNQNEPNSNTNSNTNTNTNSNSNTNTNSNSNSNSNTKTNSNSNTKTNSNSNTKKNNHQKPIDASSLGPETSSHCKDAVVVVRFRLTDGGLLSYWHTTKGEWTHTLNTKSGLQRKIKQLEIFKEIWE